MSLQKSKDMLIIGIGLGIVVLIAMTQSVYAGAECASLGGGCDDGGWDPMAKLDEIGNLTASQKQTSAKWPEKSRAMRWNMSASGLEDEENKAYETLKDAEAIKTAQNATPTKVADDQESMARSDETKAILAPLDAVTDADILLDVSENSSMHIAGSVVVPYMEFDVEAGILKPVHEISKILGDAGISREDSVVIYGECLPCGGGPSVATYVYWMMKGLGHEKIKILDGTAEDWAASGRSTTKDARLLSGKIYVPAETANFTATYEFVKSGQAQIVDARPLQEFGSGSIPGSISIPYESVLNGKKIKGEDQLDKVFMLLDKDQPVVVFTNTGMKASVVWFALVVMGYDARLYSWRDWQENKPKFNFELIDVSAKPNPVKSGSTTTITASFQKKQLRSVSNSSDREIKLKVMGVGCSTCGFEGFSLGAANLAGNKSGFVQLGSSNGIAARAEDSAFHCTAIINGPSGSETARTSLLRTSGDKYMGIWNAEVAPGVYNVSISATTSGIEEIFAEILKIEVKA
jgi:thiosulfate/3-mercaptopyruvate sulfurtransferase